MNEQNLIKQFTENIKMEFDVKTVSIYKNGEKFCGSLLDSAAIEKYLALPCTTIYKSSGSKFVTRFAIGNNLYLIYFSSDSSDTFDGIEAGYILADIKKIMGKLGD